MTRGTLPKEATGTAMYLTVFAAFSALVLGGFSSSEARAQAAVSLDLPDVPIPEAPYESWSLFLICNPRWVLPQSDDDLQALYDRFLSFGGAIGPRHAALWFWNNPATGSPHAAVDIVRSAAWCDLLNLPLDENPHVVITTDYPGQSFANDYPESFNVPENYVVLSLNGLGAEETTALLTEFAQRILDDRILQVDTKSEAFWRGWQRLFATLRGDILGASSRVTVSIHSEFFNVDVDLSP